MTTIDKTELTTLTPTPTTHTTHTLTTLDTAPTMITAATLITLRACTERSANARLQDSTFSLGCLSSSHGWHPSSLVLLEEAIEIS